MEYRGEGIGIPIFEPHYIAHMLTDPLWIAIAGKLAGDLWNQNNIVYEVSTKTTIMEREVIYILAKAICGWEAMLMETPDFEKPKAFGRLTSCGTIANLEALWFAREKVALSKVIRDFALKYLKESVILGDREIEIGELGLGDCIRYFWDILIQVSRTKREALELLIKKILKASVNKQGLSFTEKEMVIITSKRAHYSIDKIAGLLGVGHDNLEKVGVDDLQRMDMNELENKLNELFEDKKDVVAVVPTLGTTEFCSFDPLNKIVQIREKLYEKDGRWFLIHADAAWGGAFALLINKCDGERNGILDEDVEASLRALGDVDTVTIDPHKLFFIPYPAGAIIYRDFRDAILISTHAPYLFHEELKQKSQGFASSEGSKPGSTAVSVWLTFRFMTSDRAKTFMELPRCKLLDRYKDIIKHGIMNTRKLHLKLGRIEYVKLVPTTRPPGNILTFQLKTDKMDDKEFVKHLNRAFYNMINHEFLYGRKTSELEKRKRFMISFDEIEGGILRVVPINPFITDEILDEFVQFISSNKIRNMLRRAEEIYQDEDKRKEFKEKSAREAWKSLT